MNERKYILSKLDKLGRETFLATEDWNVVDWRKIRDDEYYSTQSRLGANSYEFRRYKLNKILRFRRHKLNKILRS